ncbi:Leucine efflux protein [Rhodococcoides fascians]|nr:Leucine efflux protein [Rhodococcus fascians]
MFAALGALGGLSVHMIVSAIGLSALIVAVPGSLTVLSAIGAAYLAYLGIRALVESRRLRQLANNGPTAEHLGTEVQFGIHAFRATFVTNLTNPKVVLFFVAVLPQFVDRSSSWPVALQLAILGFIDVVVGVVYLPVLVIFGVKAFRNLGSRGVARLEFAVGVALIVFAVALIVEAFTV